MLLAKIIIVPVFIKDIITGSIKSKIISAVWLITRARNMEKIHDAPSYLVIIFKVKYFFRRCQHIGAEELLKIIRLCHFYERELT